MAIPYAPPTVTAAGLIVPSYSSIFAYILQQYTQIYGAAIAPSLTPDSADYQTLAILALQASDVNSGLQMVWASFSPATAIGVSLDLLGKLIGTQRNQSTSSTALLTLTGTIGAIITNGQAQDTNGYFWNLPSPVTIGSGGTLLVTATCTTQGNVTANPGAINLIATPTAGWTAVTNADAATSGEAVEPDSSYRARLLISQASPSLTLRAGTAARIAAVSGVTRSIVYENPNGFTCGFGVCNTVGAAMSAVTVGASGGSSYVVNDILTVVQVGAAYGQVKVTSVSTGTVTAVALVSTALGTGYAVANNLATTGGSGSGCQIDVTAITSTLTLLTGYGLDSTDATQSVTILTATGIGSVTVGSSGGTGGTYAVNDILTVVQAGGAGGQVKVTSVSVGVVTGVVPISTSPGAGYAIANNLPTTGGGGTGCLIDITSLMNASLPYTMSSIGSPTTATLATSAGTQTNVSYFIDTAGATTGYSLGAPHSISAVVEGGASADIAQVIYNNKNPGCLTNGAPSTAWPLANAGCITVPVTDPTNGNISLNISFDVLTYEQIYVALNVHALTGFTSATQAAISAAILVYLTSLGIGETVIFSQMYTIAGSAQANPLQPTFSIKSILTGYGSATTSATLNSTSTIVVTSSVGIANGQTAVGAGIPANTTVTSISGAPNIVLSAAATSTASGVPVTFYTTGTADIYVQPNQAPQSNTSAIIINLV